MSGSFSFGLDLSPRRAPYLPGLGSKLIAFYDALYADASPVNTLYEPQRRLNLTASGVNRPTVVAAAVNGRPALNYDATNDQLVAAAAADWKFLHDGSGMTVCWVRQPAASATKMIVGTCAQANVGFVVDHVAGTGGKVQHIYQIYNGSGAIVNLSEPAPGQTTGAPHLVTCTYLEGASPEATLRIDRAQVASSNSSAAPSAANPAGALAVGGLVGSPTSFPLDGYMCSIAICSALTTPELNYLEAELRLRWGTP